MLSRGCLVVQESDEQSQRESNNPIARGAIALVRVYQRFISPLFPPCCIYSPTCSQYAVEAIEKYGFLKGTWLAFKRILRCNPFHKGGFDPVP